LVRQHDFRNYSYHLIINILYKDCLISNKISNSLIYIVKLLILNKQWKLKKILKDTDYYFTQHKKNKSDILN